MKNSIPRRARRIGRTRLAHYRNVSMDSVMALLDQHDPELDPRLEICCLRRLPKEAR